MIEQRRISRRALLGAGTVAAAGTGALGYGVWSWRLPGRLWLGYRLQLDGSPEPVPTDPAGPVHEASFESSFRPGTPEPWAWAAPLTATGEEMSPKGLPVVIVLHGWSDDHRAAFDQLAAHRYAARLANEGSQPMVVASLDGGLSYWHKRSDAEWARLVSDGLVPELERLGCDTSRIALMGWSMGGYGVLRLAAEELRGKVRAVASMSTAIYSHWTTGLQGSAFEDEADYAANNLNDKVGQLQGLPTHLACGVNDPYIPMSKWLADQLDPATTQTMWRRGDHSFNFWRHAAPVQLKFIADRI